MKKKAAQKNGLNIHLYLLVALLLIAVVGFVVIQKQNSAVPQTTNAAPSNQPAVDSSLAFVNESTKPNTSNWKKYTNSKLNVTFSYPPDVRTTPDGDTVFFTHTTEEKNKLTQCLKQPECYEYPLSIHVAKLEKKSSQSIEEYYKEESWGTHEAQTNTLKYTLGNFNSLPALQTEFSGIGVVHNTYIDRGETIILIRGNAITESAKNIQLYKQILSTVVLE